MLMMMPAVRSTGLAIISGGHQQSSWWHYQLWMILFPIRRFPYCLSLLSFRQKLPTTRWWVSTKNCHAPHGLDNAHCYACWQTFTACPHFSTGHTADDQLFSLFFYGFFTFLVSSFFTIVDIVFLHIYRPVAKTWDNPALPFSKFKMSSYSFVSSLAP